METNESIQVEAASYGDAVHQAADRLGISPKDLAVEVVDPGRSANSLGGFRPVKLRAWRRDPTSPPDGAGRIPASAVRRQSSAVGEERRGGRRGVSMEAYGPPPPPLDASLITPELVENVREVAAGIVMEMGFPSDVTAEKTRDGIRVGVKAGDKDQFLIGREGETLAALQHLVAWHDVLGSELTEAADRHQLDEAKNQISRRREFNQRHQLVVVATAHQDAVQFDLVESGRDGRVNSFQNLRVEITAGNLGVKMSI